MALTNLSQVTSSGIHTLSNYTTHNINSTGIITATEFSGNLSNSSGISTFAEIRVTGNLTVEGTTTTLDTVITEVDRLEVSANTNTVAAGIITQTGTGDILQLYDGSTKVVDFNQYGNLSITSTNPVFKSLHSGGNVTTTLFSNSTSGVVQTNSGHDLVLATGAVEKARITSNGKVGIGTNNPTHTLQLFGTSSSTFRISKSGILAYDHTFDGSTYEIKNNNGNAGIPLIIGTKISGGESLRITSAGRVAIGNATNNASPTAKFQVKADDGEAADLYIGQFDNLEATAGQSYGVAIRAGSNSTDHGFRVKNRANDTTQFLVRGDGNIGIGENSPYYKLHLKTNNSQTSLSGGTGGNWGGDGIRIENENATGGSMALAHFRTYDADWHIGTKHVGTNDSDFIFLAESDEKLRITSDGDMGLGTATPTSFGPTFQISGADPALLLQDTATAVDYYGMNIGNGHVTSWFDDSAYFAIGTAAGLSGASYSERLRIDSSGCLRIGNTHSQTTSGNTKRIALGAKGSIWGWTSGNINGAITLADNYYWDGANNRAIEADDAAYLTLRSGTLRFGTTNSTPSAGGVTGLYEKFHITNDGKIGIGHQQAGQITKELTIRPANDGGIRLVRPGASGASVMSHLELTTTTSGSVFPSGEAYTVKYNTVNNDQIFTTYAGGGTGGNISFQTGSGSGNEVERLRISSNGTTTVGPQYDQVKIEPGNGTYDGEATTLSVDGRTNDGNRVALKVDRYGSGTTATTKFSVKYDGNIATDGSVAATSVNLQSSSTSSWFQTGTSLYSTNYVWAAKNSSSNTWHSGLQTDGDLLLGNVLNDARIGIYGSSGNMGLKNATTSAKLNVSTDISGNYTGWKEKGVASGSMSQASIDSKTPTINDFTYPNSSNGMLIWSTSKIGFAAGSESPQYGTGVQMLFDSGGLILGGNRAFDRTTNSTTATNWNLKLRTDGQANFKGQVTTNPLLLTSNDSWIKSAYGGISNSTVSSLNNLLIGQNMRGFISGIDGGSTNNNFYHIVTHGGMGYCGTEYYYNGIIKFFAGTGATTANSTFSPPARMQIEPSDIRVYSGTKFRQNDNVNFAGGMRTFHKQGYAQGNHSLSMTFTVAASQNTYLVIAGFNHYGLLNYGATYMAFASTGPSGPTTNTINNVGTSLGGTWSISQASGAQLTVAKSAGSYNGGGYWFVHILSSS